MKFSIFFLLFHFSVFANVNLETPLQDFVLETRRIEIPGYPYAFNPSIIQWKDFILMTFRVVPNPKTPYSCWLGALLLDQDFNPIGEPQILTTQGPNSEAPPRAEDARLIYIGGELHIIYSDNPHLQLSAGGFRMVVAKLVYEQGMFSIVNPCRLTEYEGEQSNLREKNWVPFEYGENLCLAYSISPHLIFQPIPNSSLCMTLAASSSRIQWDWGIPRGGTPALLLPTGEYLAFFHSVKKMATIHSKGKEMKHYLMGAYTFSGTPPFQLTRMSPQPIVGPRFYSGAAYSPYWGSNQCVFPMGFMMDQSFIWLSYGRQDHEIWIAKLDKQKLLDSLIALD